MGFHTQHLGTKGDFLGHINHSQDILPLEFAESWFNSLGQDGAHHKVLEEEPLPVAKY